jgi:hypothetical protein
MRRWIPKITAGGGGSPAWTDSLDPATLNGSDINMDKPYFQAVTAGRSGNCTKVRWWITLEFDVQNNIKVALYDNSNNLLSTGSAASVSATSGSWVEIDITSHAVTIGTTYKVAFSLNVPDQFLTSFFTGASDGEEDDTTTYSSFPIDPETALSSSGVRFPAGMFIGP